MTVSPLNFSLKKKTRKFLYFWENPSLKQKKKKAFKLCSLFLLMFLFLFANIQPFPFFFLLHLLNKMSKKKGKKTVKQKNCSAVILSTEIRQKFNLKKFFKKEEEADWKLQLFFFIPNNHPSLRRPQPPHPQIRSVKLSVVENTLNPKVHTLRFNTFQISAKICCI